MSTDKAIVEAATHELGGKTQGFNLKYDSKNIFFTVTDPDYGKPKGTLVYFHGPNEFSELLGDQIEKWTDAGYRVVTMDMPGAGLSSKDSEIGSESLLHIDSFGDATKAAEKVLLHVQNKYGTKEGNLMHFVSNSAGSLVALNTMRALPAGTVGSWTAISPVFDIDLDYDQYTDRDDDDPKYDEDGLMDKAHVNEMSGAHLTAKRDDFLKYSAHRNRSDGPWTTGYFNAMANAIEEVDDQRGEILSVVKRNNIKLAFVLDSNEGSIYNADAWNDWQGIDGVTASQWAKASGLKDLKITDMKNAGTDLGYNPERAGEVLAAVDGNTERSSAKIWLVNRLKTVFRDEWNHLKPEERRNIQNILLKKGYDLGPTKADGIPSYGAVSYTEHAIAELLLRHGKNSSNMKDADFTPAKVKDIIQVLGSMTPDVQPAPIRLRPF
jgi:pimeloyl-ACP methyl ester carboxylesterase